MYADGRQAERGGHVLGPAVVADVKVRRQQKRWQVAQAGLADQGKHLFPSANLAHHLIGDRGFIGAADDDDVRAGASCEQVDETGEGGGGPLLVHRTGAGMHAHHRPVEQA